MAAMAGLLSACQQTRSAGRPGPLLAMLHSAGDCKPWALPYPAFYLLHNEQVCSSFKICRQQDYNCSLDGCVHYSKPPTVNKLAVCVDNVHSSGLAPGCSPNHTGSNDAGVMPACMFTLVALPSQRMLPHCNINCLANLHERGAPWQPQSASATR